MIAARFRRLALIAIASAVFMAHAPADGTADTITATRTGDPEPNGCAPRDCSLREAVLKANTASGPDQIVLRSGATYRLTSAALGDLDIQGPVLVRASQSRRARVRSDGADGVFEVHAYASDRPTRFARLKVAGGDSPAAAGAISASHGIAVVDCALKRNRGATAGAIHVSDGDLAVKRSSISGNASAGAAEESAGAAVFGARVDNARFGDEFVVERSRVIGNTSAGGAGGFFTGDGLLLTRGSRIAGNRGATHGAIDAGDEATLVRSRVLRNSGRSGAGGIAMAPQAVPGRNASVAHLGVYGSTLARNSGFTAGAAEISGIANFKESTISRNTSATVGGGVTAESASFLNSTIAHNRAAGDGGGVYAHGRGLVRLVYTTLARNRADADRSGAGTGGGVASADPDVPTFVANALIAFNEAGGAAQQCAGAFDSVGGNLRTSNDAGCAGFDGRREQVSGGPGIGRLGDHGGPTETIPLRRRSPAIDGASRGIAFQNFDQRGRPRGFPDIGAFEFQRGDGR